MEPLVLSFCTSGLRLGIGRKLCTLDNRCIYYLQLWSIFAIYSDMQVQILEIRYMVTVSSYENIILLYTRAQITFDHMLNISTSKYITQDKWSLKLLSSKSDIKKKYPVYKVIDELYWKFGHKYVCTPRCPLWYVCDGHLQYDKVNSKVTFNIMLCIAQVTGMTNQVLFPEFASIVRKNNFSKMTINAE